jgi:hypothetical protein
MNEKEYITQRLQSLKDEVELQSGGEKKDDLIVEVETWIDNQSDLTHEKLLKFIKENYHLVKKNSNE